MNLLHSPITAAAALLMLFCNLTFSKAQAKKQPIKKTVSKVTTTKPVTSKFGALAIDRSNGFYYGFSYDYPTLPEAEKKATDECNKKGGDCSVVLSFSGAGCIAYRTINGNAGNAYGWGIASTKEAADAIAMREALKRSNGTNPSNYVWTCNSKNADSLEILKNLTPASNQLFGLKSADGGIYDYEGEISNGLPHGVGVQTYRKDGSVYKASFINGVRNGKGSHTFKNGARFEGTFKDDNYDGIGTYHFRTGRKYVGEFKNGKMNGQGKIYDSSGKLVYEGKFVNNEYAN